MKNPNRTPAWRRHLTFWRTPVAQDVGDELRFHTNMRVKEFIARGMSEDEARRAVAERLGDVNAAHSECVELSEVRERNKRNAAFLDAVRTDLRYAIRRRRLSITIVLLIGLTLAPVIASLSFLEASSLRSLGVRRPDRTVGVFSRLQWSDGNARARGLSFPDFVDLRSALPADLVSAAAASVAFDGIVENEQSSARVRVTAVSTGYFEMAASRLSTGRTFSNAESPGVDEVVLSNGLWRTLGNPRMPAPVTVNGQRLNAVGVMDATSRGFRNTDRTDIWIPFAAYPAVIAEENILRYREVERIQVVIEARDVSQMSRLAATIDAFGPTLRPHHEGPGDWRLGSSPTARSLWRSLRSDRATGAGMLPLYIASCLLIITLANLANIFAVRAASRHRETHIQVALGASRARLVTQAVLEPLMLGAAGGIVGVIAAHLLISAPRRVAFLEAMQMTIGPVITALAILIAIVVSLVLAIVPVRFVLATRGVEVIREAAGVAVRGVSGWQRFFVALQFGLALAMTAIVAQFIDAVRRSSNVDIGFVPAGLVSITMPPTPTEMTRSDWRARYDKIEAAVRATPGVTAVAGSHHRLDDDRQSTWAFSTSPTARATPGAAGVTLARFGFASPGFFATIRLPLLAGREFSDIDGPSAPLRVLINEALAKQLWPGRNPVGLTGYYQGKRPAEVIGVVATIVSPSGRADPTFYVRHDQIPLRSFELYARVSESGRGDVTILRTLRETLAAADASMGRRANVQLVSEQLDAATIVTRSSMWVGIAVGGASLVIACIGLFGLTSYVVLLRRKELAIRAALGGSPRRLFLLILRDGYAFAALGTLIGVPLAVIGSRLTRWLVVGISGAPIVASLGALAVFLVVAFAGSVVPARRTAAIAPARVLSEL